VKKVHTPLPALLAPAFVPVQLPPTACAPAPDNRVVQDWGKYLGDATMATTILDRLMHRCAMLEFEGKSYRLKEAASRIAITPT